MRHLLLTLAAVGTAAERLLDVGGREAARFTSFAR